MEQRTKIFLGFVIALGIVMGYFVYTWQQHAAGPLVTSLATTTPPATASSTASLASTSIATTKNASLYPPPSLGEGTGIVSFDGHAVYVDLARTPAEQELGLGGRRGLGAQQGMLFIFPSDGIHMFWMKDMSFSIDMIWMSADGTVMYIQPNVAPSTYPEAFGPNQASRYVLEVPANFAAENGITVGSKATLP